MQRPSRRLDGLFRLGSKLFRLCALFGIFGCTPLTEGNRHSLEIAYFFTSLALKTNVLTADLCIIAIKYIDYKVGFRTLKD